MMRNLLSYLAARLRERSTLGDLAAAVAAGAFLPSPWSYACLALGIAKALIPDGRLGGSRGAAQ